MTELTHVENMDLDGVHEAIASAETEGWEPGLSDALAFHAADPHGFFRSTSEGRTVATVSVVRGSDEAAFVGLYIVAPQFRGRGLGKALWDEVLGRFEGFTLGLDAVPEQVATYASDGFVAAYGNARYSIDPGELPPPDPSFAARPVDSVPFDGVVAFDAARFFGPRPAFLREWIAGPGRDAIVAVEHGEISGFAASRRTSAGHRLGPVFATSPDIARDLILTLSAPIDGKVTIDIPQPNRAAVELLESLGMRRSFATTRMYRGPAPALPLDEIFGITTLELG